MACSGCGKSRSPLQIKKEDQYKALHGKKIILPNKQVIQFHNDPTTKKLTATKLN